MLQFLHEATNDKPDCLSRNNFLKVAKWSSDGTCWITNSDDNVLRLYALPPSVDNSDDGDYSVSSNRQVDYYQAVVAPWTEVSVGEAVYDVCWHPLMDNHTRQACCFGEVSRGHPIHLRFAADGSVVSSYLPYNNVDEVTHTYCVGFSSDGQRLYGGVKDGLRVFDVNRPGRQIEDRMFRLKNSKSGKLGIVSCLAFKQFSVARAREYAVGSFSNLILVHRDGQNCSDTLMLKDETAPSGGCVQVEWASENVLVGGYRHDDLLRSWDVRMPTSPYGYYPRSTPTGQKFKFSVKDNVLWSGDSEGCVSVYDIQQTKLITSVAVHCAPCVAVDYHPRLPLLLTSSGTRTFPPILADAAIGTESESSADDSSEECKMIDEAPCKYYKNSVSRKAVTTAVTEDPTGASAMVWGDKQRNCCRVWRCEEPQYLDVSQMAEFDAVSTAAATDRKPCVTTTIPPFH